MSSMYGDSESKYIYTHTDRLTEKKLEERISERSVETEFETEFTFRKKISNLMRNSELIVRV